MARLGEKFSAFGVTSIHDFRRIHAKKIIEAIQHLSDEELFARDEEQVIAAMTEALQLHPPVITFADSKKTFIPRNSASGYRSPGSREPQQLIEYTLPVAGDAGLLKVQPSSTQMIGFNGTPELYLLHDGIDGAVAFLVPDFGSTQDVIREVSQILDNLRVNSERLCIELNNYNSGVRDAVKGAIAAEKSRREQESQRQQNLLDQLP